MAFWYQKRTLLSAVIQFPGTLLPRPEDFEYLHKFEITLERAIVPAKDGWSLKLHHAGWGDATLTAIRGMPGPPASYYEFDYTLTNADRGAGRAAQSILNLTAEPQGHALRDRKHLLRFVGAVMGADGVMAHDLGSGRFWTPSGLASELMHEADCDVSALYSIHAVRGATGKDCDWFHSHGLAEIGLFDFDILRPSFELLRYGIDVIRGIGYQIVEALASQTSRSVVIASPGGVVDFVPVSRFARSASAAHQALRSDPEKVHFDNRAVLCEPARGFRRFFGRRCKPASFFQRNDTGFVVHFSDTATALMAQRARATFGCFCQFRDELQAKAPNLVKVGRDTDRGGREHLWFSVVDANDRRIKGRLENAPFDIAALKQGAELEFSVDEITEWTILTPWGPIAPHDFTPLHRMREARDKAAVAKASMA